MRFLEKYVRAREQANSVLCIGLDPASPFFRPGKAAAPKQYFEHESESDGLLNFCLDAVEKTHEHACAYKLNAQYAMGFDISAYRKLNTAIHKHNKLSIYDLKLGDIGSTNDSATYWASQAGFDALTFSPFAGNIAGGTASAHSRNLGIFVLTLMSNPEASIFMRGRSVDGKIGYEWIAEECKKAGSDGLVVGATSTTTHELATIRTIAGHDAILLVPGIGAQGGGEEKIFRHGGENLLINVGRDIMYAKNAREAAEEYNTRFNHLRVRK